MKSLRRQKGTTLIETLVSMIIIAVTALGGMALYHNSSQIKSMAVHKKLALEAANSKLEEIRAMNYGALATGTTTFNVNLGGVTYYASNGDGMTLTVTDTGQGYKQVQVDVDWAEKGQIGRDFNVQLITYKRP